MRFLLQVLFLLLLSVSVRAQSTFEGLIAFTVSLDGEQAMMMQAFMPEKFIYQFENEKAHFQMKGGMMEALMGDIITNAKTNEYFMVNHSSKTAYKMDEAMIEANKGKTEDVKPVITKLSETQKILGYTCEKYKISIEAEGTLMDQYMWVTDEIKVPMPKHANKMSSNNIFYEGLEGFPLKIEMSIPKAAVKMTMLVTEVTPKDIESSIFQVPSGYKVEKFDPAKLMGGFGK